MFEHLIRDLARIAQAALLPMACLAGSAGATECDSGTVPPPLPAVPLHAWHGFLHSPTRLALDSRDNLYVADPLNGRVVARAPDGRIIEDLRGFEYPVSVAVDASGRLFVGEGHAGRVDVYGPGRERVAVLGQGDAEFGLPGHIALHEDASRVRVFVSDAHADEVLAYDAASGLRLMTIGGTGSGDGQFLFPSGLAVAAGELYVVDRGNSRVQVFGVDDGDFRRHVVPPTDRCGFLCAFEGSTRGRPRDGGIHVSSQGVIYLAEASKGRVVAIAADGTLLGTIGDYGRAPGQLRVPSDVAIDSCGRVLVASSANARLEVFGLPGHVDPEAFAAAAIEVVTVPLDPTTDTTLVVRLALPGHRLDTVSGVTANGTATPVSEAIGDSNADNLPDLTFTFGSDLVQALAGASRAEVRVAGSVGTLAFEASAPVTVVVRDGDGDGVDDPADACPGTRPESPVDTAGCGIEQLCPCGHDADGGAWRSHGAYVSCVTRTAGAFVAAGLLTSEWNTRHVSAAARAQCGKPANARKGDDG